MSYVGCCDECEDYIEDEIYCRCCYGWARKEITRLKAEIEALRKAAVA